MTSQDLSLGSPVYERYKDHVLFKNLEQPLEESVERETIGCLSKATSRIILVEHNRTTTNLQPCKGQSTGLITLKNCIARAIGPALQKPIACGIISQVKEAS
ncbi:MAG: hypothetical protein ACLQO7_08005 [Candidatus Bathyarchaeia archaeon]